MKAYIILLPTFFGLLYLFLKLPTARTPLPLIRIFLNLYLPCLLLLPQAYRLGISGILNFNFGEAALLPLIATFWMFPQGKNEAKTRAFCRFDALMIGFVALLVISEWINAELPTKVIGESPENFWRTALYRGVLNIFFPYYFARRWIYAFQLTETFAKRIILFSLINLALSAYEARMTSNLHYELLYPFFAQTTERVWTPIYRYGLVRIYGPSPHPILFGTTLGAAFLFNYWLARSKLWKPRWLPVPFGSKIQGMLIGMILLLGLLLTFSRGPLFSTLPALLIARLGFVHHKKFSFLLTLGIFLVLGILAWEAAGDYTLMDINLAALNREDQTIAYRSQLFQKYSDAIEARPWWGWGTLNWPVSSGMQSIDNQYLWLTLKNGLVATAVFVLILFSTLARLALETWKIPPGERFRSSLGFTLLSILFMIGLTLVTVYMGDQLEQLTYMVIGIAQGFLTAPSKTVFSSEIVKGISSRSCSGT